MLSLSLSISPTTHTILLRTVLILTLEGGHKENPSILLLVVSHRCSAFKESSSRRVEE
ncbi:hypothetical protein HanIR_Chr16g0828791 [Helianthus annuus]|nr:hypothetical protein HanIR_Chr16g0828791 [Helianthus annuus]